MSDPTGKTTIVVGASRGLGRGIATAFAAAGAPAVEAYAARAGLPLEEFLEQQHPLVTPEIAGTALVELVQADAATVAPGYRLSGAGLQKLRLGG